MSVKSTQRVTREKAIETIISNVPILSNDDLGELMDTLADCNSSHLSKFDNFIVSDFLD